MAKGWASSNLSGVGDVFTTLHSGLAVELISTPASSLATCTQDELIRDVLERNRPGYDFIPVANENARFIGMFNAFSQRDRSTQGTIRGCFLPLSEEYLIGADASILDFILDADQRPCRLVISGAKIVGLVSLSDLQRLPVRATLFALITGFEITMAEFIKKRHPSESGWLEVLAARRQQKIKDEMSDARADDGFVESLLFTQFFDKTTIVARQFPENQRKSLEAKLRRIEHLRNHVAHANDYAATPSLAKNVCEVVRELLEIRGELQNLSLA
ncbi:hypothetical protein HAP48_0016975 [Bradyrhizobium septentrionale]|uniref:CBS domain-containing protein n=1 Tax=Bradyrhizobium septentrionale TaxID=1404411 RepID=A0A973VTW2_9BRAD|nr:hypothetical protein [Bradyrhizobium septentrionale]UGY18992.1 hypothetical protein HAP48_0016975 [Bradyrhizobium septentrionale]